MSTPRARRLLASSLVPLLLLLSGCSSLGLGTSGSASPVSDRIRESGELRIGMTGDYPPLNVIDLRDQNIGLEPDLAQALASSMGVSLKIVNKPFSELLPALEAGEVDAVMSGMTMTPDRNLKVAFAGPYFVSGKAILTKSSTLATAESLGEIQRSIQIAVLEGSTSQTMVEGAQTPATVVTVASYDAGVQMVLGGEVDAMLADYPIAMLAVLRNPSAGLVSAISPLTFEPIGIALPGNDPLFVNLVQNYLASLEVTGILNALRAKWFEDSSWLRSMR